MTQPVDRAAVRSGKCGQDGATCTVDRAAQRSSDDGGQNDLTQAVTAPSSAVATVVRTVQPAQSVALLSAVVTTAVRTI